MGKCPGKELLGYVINLFSFVDTMFSFVCLCFVNISFLFCCGKMSWERIAVLCNKSKFSFVDTV